MTNKPITEGNSSAVSEAKHHSTAELIAQIRAESKKEQDALENTTAWMIGQLRGATYYAEIPAQTAERIADRLAEQQKENAMLRSVLVSLFDSMRFVGTSKFDLTDLKAAVKKAEQALQPNHPATHDVHSHSTSAVDPKVEVKDE